VSKDRLPGAALAALLGAGINLGVPAQAAQGLGEVVRGFCLSAFASEMARAGKTAPAGMADYACSCVAHRIEAGSGLVDAQESCRRDTVRRYPI
jgi:hypothetical protein